MKEKKIKPASMSRAQRRAKYKNVTLDADLHKELMIVADALEAKFGFRPTLSQVLRHMLQERGKP